MDLLECFSVRLQHLFEFLHQNVSIFRTFDFRILCIPYNGKFCCNWSFLSNDYSVRITMASGRNAIFSATICNNISIYNTNSICSKYSNQRMDDCTSTNIHWIYCDYNLDRWSICFMFTGTAEVEVIRHLIKDELFLML